MLVTLERANLFLVPLDDQRVWYRYHHLFADVLKARLLSYQPEQVPLSHQRASRWYEAHDLVEDAVRHALAARDHVSAARLMELAMPAIRRERQDTLMLGWLRELPEAAVRRSPVLSVFAAYASMVAGDLDAFGRRLDDAERALTAGPDASAPWGDTDELRTLPAPIAVYRASIAQARGDVEAAAIHARTALDLAGPTDHLARCGAAGFLGLAAWTRGDVPGALEHFTQAVASLRDGGNHVDELNGTVALADMRLAAGQPGTSRLLYERALQVAGDHGSQVAGAVAGLHVGLSELDREAGDFPAARAHLELAAALGERSPGADNRYRWFVAGSRLVDATGDPLEVVGLLDQAQRLYHPGFFPNVRPIAAVKARMWIALGTLAPAREWARDRGLSPTDEVSYLSEFEHLTLVRLQLALYRAQPGAGGLDQVTDLLGRLHETAETSGRGGSLLEIRILQALTHLAGGHRPRALQALAQAWAGCEEPAAYVRLFLDEGAPMTELLRDAEQHGIGGGRAQSLLDVGTAGEEGDMGIARDDRSAPMSVELLSHREMQVLRLLAGELSGPQIARELFVSHNTLRSHTKHIFTKLDVTNRRAAVRRGRERGLM